MHSAPLPQCRVHRVYATPQKHDPSPTVLNPGSAKLVGYRVVGAADVGVLVGAVGRSVGHDGRNDGVGVGSGVGAAVGVLVIW